MTGIPAYRILAMPDTVAGSHECTHYFEMAGFQWFGTMATGANSGLARRGRRRTVKLDGR